MRRLISIRIWIYTLMLILSLGGMSTPIVSAQSTEPYIYYYHPDLKAWIIERADGTDGRLLGQDLTERSNETRYATWSHSGEWLAWIGRYIDGSSSGGDPRWHAVKADGTHTVTISKPFKEVDLIQWAAQSDYLFVQENSEARNSSLSLIDVANEKILWSEIATEQHQRAMGRLVGDYFVYWDYDDSDFSRQQDSIKILSLSTGVTMSLPDDAASREAYKQFVDPKLINHPFVFLGISRNQINFLILDIVNGALHEIDRQGMYGVGYAGEDQWSSDGQYTLIGKRYICANGMKECIDIWLFSPKQGVMQHIADKIISSNTFWVRNELTIILGSEDGSVSIYDVRSGSTKSIAGVKGTTPLIWVASGDTLFFEDHQDMQTFDEVSISEGRLLKQSRLAIDDFYWPDEYSPNNLGLSPNGRYVGLGNAQALYDLEAKSVLNIPPHSGATYGNRKYAYYNWDVTSQWLIAGQATSYVDGGGLPRNMILRVDGSNRRELNTGGKPDWLPDRVISHLPPAQLKSVLPQPYLTLEHPGYVTAAALNATGKRLAVIVDSQVYIWSFEQAKPQVEHVIPLDMGCGGGQSGVCHINWSNDDHFISLGPPWYGDTYGSSNFSLIDVERGVFIGRSDYPFEWGVKGFSISNQKPHSTKADNLTLSAEVLKLDETNDTVVIHQKDTQQIVFKFSIKGKVASLWWTEDKQHLMVLQNDCSLQEWSVKNGLQGIFNPYTGCINRNDYAVSPKGKWAITEWVGDPSVVYAFGSNQPPRSLNWYAKSVSFTPDDCWLTASNSWLVTIWKLSDLIPDGSSETDTCIPLVKGTYKVKPS